MVEILGYFFYVLSVLTLLATLIPLSTKKDWWIRAFDFPRLQIIVAGIFCLAGFWFFNHGNDALQLTFEIGLVCCLIYQSWRIFPYTILAKKVVLDTKLPQNERDQISIVVTNVLMENSNYEACLKMLRNAKADVILALETNYLWHENLKELEKDYPYTVFMPLENTYGMLLYSKLKLKNQEVKFLLRTDVPSIHTIIELPSGAPVFFHGLHPKPPAPQETSSSASRDAELIVVGYEIKGNSYPTIVAGDLNDVAWSHTSKLFRKTSGLLDPRIGRGLFATFNAFYPLFRWPLDHIFHSRDFRLISLKRLEAIGSDHFPICISLSYEPEKKQEQHKPKADTDDKKEARDELRKTQQAIKES